MNIFIKTLGCKSNRADSDKLLEKLAEKFGDGLRVNDPSYADVCVIATCTVTHVADRKSRSAVSMMKRRFPEARVVVIGCGPRVDRASYDEIGCDFVGVSVEEAFEYINGVEVLGTAPEGSLGIGTGAGVDNDRTRSALKIQDGCNNFCTYCIIPFARGREKSVGADEVLAEVGRKLKARYKELVLTGINIGNWSDGDGEGAVNLGGLILRILDETSLPRLRLSSIEPQNFGKEFETLLTDEKYRDRFCPHLHMSLQSGSDSVLKAMRRHYDAKLYKKVAQKMTKLRPEIALTTDVIVGFPGETDADFEETMRFVEEIGFSKVHVFPYSKRAGTKAALMDDQITDQVKKARAKTLQELSDRLMAHFSERNLGETYPVLLEQKVRGSEDLWEGFTPNYIKVQVQSDEDLFNQIRDVRLEKFLDKQKAPIVRGLLV
jgi:threonylcarbamoyladenosine tRNA methylthiotransferase MtaB